MLPSRRDATQTIRSLLFNQSVNDLRSGPAPSVEVRPLDINVIQQNGQCLMADLAAFKQDLESPPTTEGRNIALHRAKRELGNVFSPKMLLLALFAYLPSATAACNTSTVTLRGTTYSFTGAAINEMLAAKTVPTTSADEFHANLMATFRGYNQAYMAVTTSPSFENYCPPDESTLPQQMAAAFNTTFSMGSGSDQTKAATLLSTHSLLPPYSSQSRSSCPPATTAQYDSHCSDQLPFYAAKATLLGVNAQAVERQVCADTVKADTNVCLSVEVVHHPASPSSRHATTAATPATRPATTPAPKPAPTTPYTWMGWLTLSGAAVALTAAVVGVGYGAYKCCKSHVNPHLERLKLRDEDVTTAIREAVNGIPSARIINNKKLMEDLSHEISTFAEEKGVIEDSETLERNIEGIINDTYKKRDDAGKALLHEALMTCYQNYNKTGNAQNSFDPSDIKRECLRRLFNNDSDQFKPEIVTSLWALTAKKRLFEAHIGLKPEDLSTTKRFTQDRELYSVDTESKLGQKCRTTIPGWVLDDRENSADVLTTHILKAFELTGSTQTTERTSLKETINTALTLIVRSTNTRLNASGEPNTDKDVMFEILKPGGAAPSAGGEGPSAGGAGPSHPDIFGELNRTMSPESPAEVRLSVDGVSADGSDSDGPSGGTSGGGGWTVSPPVAAPPTAKPARRKGTGTTRLGRPHRLGTGGSARSSGGSPALDSGGFLHV